MVTARRQRIADPRLVEKRRRRHHRAGHPLEAGPTSNRCRCCLTRSAKQQAKEAGAYEAWQVDAHGNVTEGTSSNAWIVTDGDEVVTRQADGAILNGVTRLGVFDILARDGLRLVERPFSVAEAKAAREAMLTSATNGVLPVVASTARRWARAVPARSRSSWPPPIAISWTARHESPARHPVRLGQYAGR